MNSTRLTGLLSFGALMLTACVTATVDDTGGTTTNGTMTNGMTAAMTDEGGSDSEGGTADDAPATGSSGGDASSGGADASTGGTACTPQDQCMSDEQCDGGTCLSDCTCFGGGDETGAVMSTYGPCNMCAAGETQVRIEGLEGFCVCAPACEGMGSPCPDPGTGVEAQCALGMPGGTMPTLCAIVCTSADQCPEGVGCEMVPGQPVSICMAPG